MLELMDLVILSVVAVLFSGFFSLIFGVILAFIGLTMLNLKDAALVRRVKSLEEDVDHMIDSANGKAGVVAKNEKAERMQNSIIKGALVIKEALDKKVPTDQILKEIAPKVVTDFAMENPDVAIAAAKKGLKSL